MPADEMRDQAGERQAGIADDGADRIAHAGVDAAARHDRAVEPALEPAGKEIADGEDEDAGEDPGGEKRNDPIVKPVPSL